MINKVVNGVFGVITFGICYFIYKSVINGVKWEIVASLIATLVAIVVAFISYHQALSSQKESERVQKEIQEKIDNNAIEMAKKSERFQKSLNDENNEFIAKWEQNKIDADIKAKARIDWIQDVRKLTAVYISDFYLFVNGKEKNWIDIQKNVELLILYFGKTTDAHQQDNYGMYIENDRIKIDDKTREILINNKSNDSKNDYLGTYLSIHNDLFEQIDYDKIVGNIEKLERSINSIYSRINGIYMESEQVWAEEYIDHLGEYIPFVENVILSDEDKNKIDKYNEETNKYKQKISEERDKLEYHKVHLKFLREIVSIYLKIEWDIAKEGK